MRGSKATIRSKNHKASRKATCMLILSPLQIQKVAHANLSSLPWIKLHCPPKSRKYIVHETHARTPIFSHPPCLRFSSQSIKMKLDIVRWLTPIGDHLFGDLDLQRYRDQHLLGTCVWWTTFCRMHFVRAKLWNEMGANDV